MVQLKIKIWTKRKIKRFRESIDKKVIFEWGVIAVLLFIAYFMFNYLLMPQINLNGGKHIVINYKDRLIRFGFEMIEHLCLIYDVEIEIINHTDDKTHEEELVDDDNIISVILILGLKKLYSIPMIINDPQIIFII